MKTKITLIDRYGIKPDLKLISTKIGEYYYINYRQGLKTKGYDLEYNGNLVIIEDKK
jgi:hypothetical protein